MIAVTDEIEVDESEIELKFVRSGGPGGQHVNKVSTAVQLRFDVAGSPSLPDDVRERLLALAGSRSSDEGVLTIEANRYRSQSRNREDAMARFIDLLQKAAKKPKKRRSTTPSAKARERRLQDKRRRATVKRQRNPIRDEE